MYGREEVVLSSSCQVKREVEGWNIYIVHGLLIRRKESEPKNTDRSY